MFGIICMIILVLCILFGILSSLYEDYGTYKYNKQYGSVAKVCDECHHQGDDVKSYFMPVYKNIDKPKKIIGHNVYLCKNCAKATANILLHLRGTDEK